MDLVCPTARAISSERLPYLKASIGVLWVTITALRDTGAKLCDVLVVGPLGAYHLSLIGTLQSFYRLCMSNECCEPLKTIPELF
jgi:hypothetical protein